MFAIGRYRAGTRHTARSRQVVWRAVAGKSEWWTRGVLDQVSIAGARDDTTQTGSAAGRTAPITESSVARYHIRRLAEIGTIRSVEVGYVCWSSIGPATLG